MEQKIYCNNIKNYETQLTKGQSYIILEVNSENIKINNDEGKLKWYSKYYFQVDKPIEIVSINIDDNLTNDIVEVTIEIETKYWTTFITPNHLSFLLQNQNFLTGNKLIFVSNISESKIKETIINLYNTNELLENCNLF